MSIKPIETVYRGYRFRSRLEARWAVFFDLLGVEWQYEPEGFESNGHRWLPDFWLPESNTWIEVKGSDKALRADWEKLVAMLDFGGVLPDFLHSCEIRDDGSIPGLLLLGPIPDESHYLIIHPLVVHHKGLGTVDAYFSDAGLHRDEVDWLKWDFLESDAANWTVKTNTSRRDRNNAAYAYRGARQARFEHGQVGAPHEWQR